MLLLKLAVVKQLQYDQMFTFSRKKMIIIKVRVPTHEDGRCIFWEFATDYYDIGFGLYFEWSKAQSNTVTVHVSDSSEDDDEGEDGINRMY
jgi:hypothetical protein